jgi:anti-sigma regulatory factor (Ser/Thr protein kinase)
MLILLERQAGDCGTEVEVVPARDDVTALLRLSGLIDRMNLVGTTPDATESAEFLERIDRELVREPTAPAQARSEVRQALGARIGEPELATLVLLTSELITNAVLHPRESHDQRVGFRMTIYPDRIRVLVDDPGDGFNPAAPVEPSETGGRGLMLVDRASTRWGTGRAATARGDRFAVWFEIALGEPAARAIGA